jgi:hypothetical protein
MIVIVKFTFLWQNLQNYTSVLKMSAPPKMGDFDKNFPLKIILNYAIAPVCLIFRSGSWLIWCK